MLSKIHGLILKTFVWLTPFGTGVIAMSFSSRFDAWYDNHGVWIGLFDVVLGIWFFAALYVMTGLVMSSRFRDSALTRFARIKERDEREEHIVGRASRGSFLFMLALLIALFAISTFRYDRPVSNGGDKKDYSITLGHLDFVSDKPVVTKITFDGKEREFASYDLPLSKTSLLLLLIVVQMASYHLFARRTQE
jgi:hypothetical protein